MELETVSGSLGRGGEKVWIGGRVNKENIFNIELVNIININNL